MSVICLDNSAPKLDENPDIVKIPLKPHQKHWQHLKFWKVVNLECLLKAIVKLPQIWG